MANVLSNPSHSAKIGYNGFNMRQRKQFTSAPGLLQPVYFDLLQPGDKVKCGVHSRTRFMPMVAPVFGNIKEHFDWFFVPLEQIYSPFGSVFYGVTDPKSASINVKGASADYFPYISTTSMVTLFSDVDTDQDYHLDSYDHMKYRLLDLLGVPVKSYFMALKAGTLANTVVAEPLWFIGAYNKIWNDHYRLDDYQAPNASLWNFDDALTNGSVSDVSRINYMFEMKEAAWKRDYLMNCKPSPLFNGPGSQTASSLTKVNQWLTGLNLISLRAPNAAVGGSTSGASAAATGNGFGDATTVGLGAASTAVQSVMNPANLRQLFASEKLLEITRRAGKHYDLQTLAHYGIDVPTGIEGRVNYLGSQHGDVMVTDIFSTAETDGAALGTLAGQAFGQVKAQNVSFEARCHGVLMCIYHVEPEVVYQQDGIDGLNSIISPVDFPRPEYDNLGMEPIFAYESRVTNTANTNRLGWDVRYHKHKIKKNVCFGGVQGLLKPWVLSRPGFTTYQLQNLFVHGDIFNSFMVKQFSYDISSNVTAEEREELGPIPTGEKLGEYIYNKMYMNDPLVNDMVFNVVKSSKMSTFGLPSL